MARRSEVRVGEFFDFGAYGNASIVRVEDDAAASVLRWCGEVQVKELERDYAIATIAKRISPEIRYGGDLHDVEPWTVYLSGDGRKLLFWYGPRARLPRGLERSFSRASYIGEQKTTTVFSSRGKVRVRKTSKKDIASVEARGDSSSSDADGGSGSLVGSLIVPAIVVGGVAYGVVSHQISQQREKRKEAKELRSRIIEVGDAVMIKTDTIQGTARVAEGPVVKRFPRASRMYRFQFISGKFSDPETGGEVPLGPANDLWLDISSPCITPLIDKGKHA